jgi:hypothetical protein
MSLTKIFKDLHSVSGIAFGTTRNKYYATSVSYFCHAIRQYFHLGCCFSNPDCRIDFPYIDVWIYFLFFWPATSYQQQPCNACGAWHWPFSTSTRSSSAVPTETHEPSPYSASGTGWESCFLRQTGTYLDQTAMCPSLWTCSPSDLHVVLCRSPQDWPSLLHARRQASPLSSAMTWRLAMTTTAQALWLLLPWLSWAGSQLRRAVSWTSSR